MTTTNTNARPAADHSTDSRAQVRALSIQQPWAGLILSGTKDVENRTWATDWRGLLVVHAGLRRDRIADQVMAEEDYPPGQHDTTGGYLGVVRLVDVHRDRGNCCDWGEDGTYHWVLAHPRPFPDPVRGRGQLRLYRPPAEIDLIARQTAHAEREA